jgi:hypothetical protein
MRINGLFDLGCLSRFVANPFDTSWGDGFGEAVSGKKPGLQPIELPVVSEQGQEVRRESHLAISLTLALTYIDDHAPRVDVGAF